MEKYRFMCDYHEGCHPALLKALTETNLVQTPGYGEDRYCHEARELIKKRIGCPNADIHFLVGGTQTNLTVITSILRPHQGALCVDDGHINVHETGAIEACGHKVLALSPTLPNGTLCAADIEEAVHAHFDDPTHEHMVQPGMVYISFPTENGEIYTKRQLEEIYAVCRKYSLPLFIDGARLGYGLTCAECDITIEELAKLCDVFYIGGTKCGALFGEAVVITNDALKKDFRYLIKQKGGMLAKGRLLGIQFAELFTNDLYFDICRQGVEKALKIRRTFEKKGIEMCGTSPTNQQFPLLTEVQINYLSESFGFEVWDKQGERYRVRFCTSWATTDEAVDLLVKAVETMPL